MNGPDDTTKRPQSGDGESWALPASETSVPAEPSDPVVVPADMNAPDAAAPEAAAPQPVSRQAPPGGRARFGTALLAVIVGASVVVGSAALAFVAFRSGPGEVADPQVPPVPSASATAAPPDANGTEPGDADDPTTDDATGPHPTRGAAPDAGDATGPDADAPAPAPDNADNADNADAADLNLGGTADCPMGPDTWRVISGDVGCAEATDVGIRYLSARDRGVGDGEGAYVYVDDWSCSAPSAARSAELGAVAVCTRADGARIHKLP